MILVHDLVYGVYFTCQHFVYSEAKHTLQTIDINGKQGTFAGAQCDVHLNNGVITLLLTKAEVKDANPFAVLGEALANTPVQKENKDDN